MRTKRGAGLPRTSTLVIAVVMLLVLLSAVRALWPSRSSPAAAPTAVSAVDGPPPPSKPALPPMVAATAATTAAAGADVPLPMIVTPSDSPRRELVLRFDRPPPDRLRETPPPLPTPAGEGNAPRVFVVTTWDCGTDPDAGWHQLVAQRAARDVPWAQMHVVLHAEPGPTHRAHVQTCAALMNDLAEVSYSWWTRPFDPRDRLKILEEVKVALRMAPHDWIVHLDGDELPELPPFATWAAFAAELDTLGVGYVQATLRDRVRHDGSVAPVDTNNVPASFFGLVCDVSRTFLARASPPLPPAAVDAILQRLVAFRAHLRPARDGSFGALDVDDAANWGQRGMRADLFALSHFRWVDGAAARQDELAVRLGELHGADTPSARAARLYADGLRATNGRICVDCHELQCRPVAAALAPEMPAALAARLGRDAAFPPLAPPR